ncbi:DUF3558 domain-containing protein [Amycolatopsis sp. NBC_01480]|uniref:DUF3558 domain-containing protein n=1 Tax=Amycolatopsis sp. NBC_01480 TaxID=2903562 RepID=UPI002E2D22BE|nr:DUF3558 domain-containing protein [Amycolatopsis sp. NBC_01480]
MTRRTVTTAVCVAVVAGVAAGCSGGPAAAPASTSPSSPTVAALPHSGAPKVEHPLPASVLSGDPCAEALTSTQLKDIIGIAPQGEHKDTAGLGPSCDWHNSDAGSLVTVSYSTEVQEGLSLVYQNTKPKSQVWRVLPPIQGFPAVAHLAIGADLQNQFCQVSVGITDELTFEATLILGNANRGKQDPCDLAPRVADMVVTNLRQKAGS